MTTPKPRTPEEQKSIDTALKVVKSIDALTSNEDFQWFMAEHGKRADALAIEILHTDMTPEKREAMRNRRLGVLDVLLSLQEDRSAQMGLLARYGVMPGDNLG